MQEIYRDTIYYLNATESFNDCVSKSFTIAERETANLYPNRFCRNYICHNHLHCTQTTTDFQFTINLPLLLSESEILLFRDYLRLN